MSLVHERQTLRDEGGAMSSDGRCHRCLTVETVVGELKKILGHGGAEDVDRRSLSDTGATALVLRCDDAVGRLDRGDGAGVDERWTQEVEEKAGGHGSTGGVFFGEMRSQLENPPEDKAGHVGEFSREQRDGGDQEADEVRDDADFFGGVAEGKAVLAPGEGFLGGRDSRRQKGCQEEGAVHFEVEPEEVNGGTYVAEQLVDCRDIFELLN